MVVDQTHVRGAPERHRLILDRTIPRQATASGAASKIQSSCFFQIFKERLTFIRDQESECTPSEVKRPSYLGMLIPDTWRMVELIGIEPTTPWLQTRCSPS